MENNMDFCKGEHCDARKMAKLKTEVLSVEETTKLSEIFKAMGDETRIKIMHALVKQELCVCELTELVRMSQSAVSHQLRVLRNLRLVKRRKEGKQVYYSLDDEHIVNIFTQGLEHIRHD